MQGSASTPTAPQQPRKSQKEWRAQHQHNYEAARQQALQHAPASVAAASAVAHATLQPAQALVQFLAQQAALQAQQQQARWQQQHEQQQLFMQRWQQEQQLMQQARAAEPSPVAAAMEDAAERRQSRAARREHKHALKQQYKQDWRAQQEQTAAQLQPHEQKYLEQFALAKRNAEQLPGRESYAFRPAEQITPTPQPLRPPPIESPEASSSPVPASKAELKGLPSRERVLLTAKLAAMAGVLACGCDGFKMMVWVILQLGFRGYTVDFTQVQSFFDFVHTKPSWLAMLAVGASHVYTGLQRACRFTVALCYKFVRSHSLTCCCHFRCNARTIDGTQLERDKHKHYRRRIRCSCQAHTHPPFRGYPCPFRDDAPVLNLHHIERTCTRETFKKLHDPKVTEREFHAYLWSSNLICLCEGCHRLEHPDLLVKGCKPDEA